MATKDEYVQYDLVFFNEFSKYLGFTKDELVGIKKALDLGLIQRERLVELAATRLGIFEMDSVSGQDFNDGSDLKTVVSCIRNNDHERGCWLHSFPVRKIQSKNGALRIIAFNKFLKKFHYFFIPHSEYRNLKILEIVVESFSGLSSPPEFTGLPKKHRKWWDFEVESFEDLCNR